MTKVTKVSPLAKSVLLPALLAISALSSSGCSKNEKTEERGSAPPPPVETAKPGACASGGGTVDDPVQGEFFVRAAANYCLEPQGDTRTYGDRGKLTMDQVCTTAVDGECEVYKSYGLKRAVIVRYVDGGGGGGSVEVILSTFGDAAGAYGMFTKRVIADADPADTARAQAHQRGRRRRPGQRPRLRVERAVPGRAHVPERAGVARADHQVERAGAHRHRRGPGRQAPGRPREAGGGGGAARDQFGTKRYSVFPQGGTWHCASGCGGRRLLQGRQQALSRGGVGARRCRRGQGTR